MGSLRLKRKRPGHYHHGDLRRALLDAALQLIDEKGLKAFTTRALARRLGVSHAAPAHHFHDREALLAEVAADGFGAFAEALETAARIEADPGSRLLAIARVYVRFALGHPSHLRVMFGRDPSTKRRPEERLVRESERAYRVLADTVEALAATARGDPGPVDELAFESWSLVHGMTILWLDGPARSFPGGQAGLETIVERALRRIIPGLIPGVRLPGDSSR